MSCVEYLLEVFALLQVIQFGFNVGGQYTETAHLHTLGSVGGKTYVADITLRSWNASFTFCERRGFDLGTIAGNREANYLKSTGYVDGWYWTAAKDLYNNGQFSWIKSGNRVSVLSLGSWWHHEPNETCLVYDIPVKFYKRACYHGHYTLCETTQSINRTSEVMVESKSGLLNLGFMDGNTYFGDGVTRTWQESKDYCQTNGMQLATIRNRNQVEFLKSQIQQIKFDGWYWVKEMKLDDDSNVETWHKDDRCPCFNLYDEHYYEHNCNHKHFTLCEVRTESSTIMQTKSTSSIGSTNLTIQQVNIDGTTATTRHDVRKSDQELNRLSGSSNTDNIDSVQTKSPDVYSLVLGQIDKKFYYADTTLRNWTLARSFCDSIGMQLATITSQNQVNFLKLSYDKINFNGLYWIGGKDHNGEGNFKWDKNREEVRTFDNLGWEGLGNEAEADLHCLAYSADDNESWNYFMGRCDEKLYTLCEMSTTISRSNMSLGLTILITIIVTVILMLLIWNAGKWLHTRYHANRQIDHYIPVYTNKSISQTTL